MGLTAAQLEQRARAILEGAWETCHPEAERITPVGAPTLPPDLVEDIQASVNSRTKTYRYVLPTQVLAKAAVPSLDCRCLQAGRGGEGAFDARSLSHNVIVPFDRQNENVLGGSSEPYANNPVRVAEVTPEHRAAQRNRAGWDALCRVLQALEDTSDPAFTQAVLREVLEVIRGRLEGTAVTYAVPQRVNHPKLLHAVEAYLSERSGGVRLQAVVASLFLTVGKRFHLFANVKSSKPTAADASTGQIADVDCYDAEGDLALAVEVKDRELTITQMSNTVLAARAADLTEVLFISQRGIPQDEAEGASQAIASYFASGQNVYVFPFMEFASGVLALLGEVGRRDFVTRVGQVLEGYQSSLSDRRAWSAVLREL